MFGPTTWAMIMPSTCGFGMLSSLISIVSSLIDIVSFTSTILAGLLPPSARRPGRPCAACEHPSRRTRASLARDHDLGAFGHVGPHAAGVIHVVMGQHQLLDRLAGILGLGGVDHPARLRLRRPARRRSRARPSWRRSGCWRRRPDVLHVRRQLDELEAAALREIDLVAVEEAAEEHAPQHPLVGHVGRPPASPCRLDVVGDREACWPAIGALAVTSFNGQPLRLRCR